MLGSSFLPLQNYLLPFATQQDKIPSLIKDVCQSYVHWVSSLKEQCHEDFAVLGEFYAKIITLRLKQKASVKLQ